MLFLKQSTASQSDLLGPFVDDTDGATAETGLTIANTDIRLSKNGGNMAAKNSGGGTHDENGWYTVTFDATDTDTVGRLKVSCKVAGALAVFAEYQVLEEDIYDALFAASAAAFDSNQRVDVGSVGGTAQTANDIGADANTLVSRLGTPSDFGSGTSTIAANLEDLADNGTAAYDRSTDSLQAIRDHVGDGTNLTEAGATGDHLTAIPWNAAWDAEVQSEATDALNAYDPPTKAELDTAETNIARKILPQKNQAYNDIQFPMVDSTNHNPLTGLTVTGVRSLDSGAHAAVTGSIAEIGNGTYQFDASAADMNGDNIEFIFSAAGADDTKVYVKTAA